MSHAQASMTGERAWRPAKRRIPVFLAVLAMHGGLILLLLLSRQIVQPQKKQGSLSVFSVAAAASAIPVPVPLPIVPTEAEPEVASPAIVFAEQQGAEGDPDGEVCSPLDQVTAQLASDPLVPLAIDRVARSDRSISEAIVMWNAEWSAASATDEAPLADVRNRVVSILEKLPPDCLATPVTGPRLIAIPDQGYTTFLAFGSGEWSWQQLTETEVIAASENKNWTWEQLLSGDFQVDY